MVPPHFSSSSIKPVPPTPKKRTKMDRLSTLPETPLSTIISFLPFKEAARTSVLSQRWRHLWRSTKNIDFDQHFFANADANREIQRRVFLEFVQNWIQNYQQPSINKLSLTLSQPRNSQVLVENCIAFSLAHNVEHLVLDFSDPAWDEDDLANTGDHPASFDLPPSVYNHQDLESLTLLSCKFDANGFKNFVALKNISLGWVEIKRSILAALLENCKLLESLTLKNCWNADEFEAIDVCGRDLKLRNFVVSKCIFDSRYFQIEAPNLKCLKYSGPVATFYVDKVEEAELEFGLDSNCDMAMGNLLYQLLDAVCPRRALTVCTYMLQVIPMGEEPTGMRPPLDITHLTLKTAMHDYEQYGIRFFFNSCPRLETLTIEIGSGRIFHDDYEAPFDALNPYKMWMRSPILYLCITQTLREVEIKGFKGTPNEVYVLIYLVRHGRVMEKLTVITSRDEVSGVGRTPEAYRRAAEQVYGFSSASQNLIITIL